MALEVEIIQPDSPATLAVESRARLKRNSRRWPLLLGLAVLALLVWNAAAGDRPERATTVIERPQVEVEVDDQPAVAVTQIQAETLVPWDGGASVIIIENSQFIYELDLRTQRRTSWAPPELLIDTDPLAVAGKLVVVGETGAWVGEQESMWTYLGSANQALQSSEPGHVWLRQTLDGAYDGYLWSEVNLEGEVKRRTLDQPRASMLSRVGRFVTSQSGQDQNLITVQSVAGDRAIASSCLRGRPLVWSPNEEVFACSTAAGLELYETANGTSLGIANNRDAKWTRAVLVEARS